MCDLNICRICLNTGTRGYKLGEYNLRRYYENVINEKLNPKDMLPEWCCYECVMMLYKYHKFKEKCVRGHLVLQQISLKGKITYESVATINRYGENLISSIGIAVANKRVLTTTIKNNHKFKTIEIKTENNHSKEESNKNTSKRFSNAIKNSTDEINIDIESINHDIDNIDHTISSDDELKSNEDILKNKIILCEDEQLEPVLQPTDPIKSEIPDCIYKDQQIINIPEINTNSDADKLNSDLENTNYESDIDYNINNINSSDDESLLSIAKKSRKVKRRTMRKKKAPKLKKMRTENEEVVLKNTKPLKLVLNPQIWKKINLSEEEAVREFKQREFNNDYYLKAKYKCQDCFKGFSKNEMLERHLRQRHDELCGDMECRFCHMRFRHKHQLVKHIKEHLIIYNCLLCKLQCSRLSTAITHQEHHNGVKKTCKHCGKEFNHLSTYYTHVRMSHRSAHVCVACGASFVSEHGLLLHTKFMHIDNLKQLENEIRKRREATNKTDAVSNDSAHSTSATDTEEIYCAKCDIKFMSRRAYNLHFFKSDNHDDKDADSAALRLTGPGSNSRAKIPTTCPHCNKNFPTRVAYKKHHLSEHSHIPLNIPKKRDICEVCGASVQMGSIQYHMKSHTGERDFACPAPQCDMRFTLKRNMKRHYNVKHLGMPSPKYIRRNPTKRKKKTQEILENDFSPFVRTRTGYFL